MRAITYPRTDSKFLTEDMAGTAENIINIILQNIPHFKRFSYNPEIKNVLNSKLVTDHTAIILTAEIANIKLDSIPDGERKILFLIANKMLCATAQAHEYEAVTAVMDCSGYSFTAKGKTVINNGWKGIEQLFKGFQKCNDEGEDTDEIVLDLHEGQSIEPVTCAISEHYTTPPKQFTEDTLLSAMEKAGADEITEEVERSGVSLCNRNYKAGLGTAATRASIIEKLIKSGFIKRDKKNIIATDEGAELISLMPEFIKSAKLTADWENGLSLISQGKLSAEKFMSEIENLTAEIVTSAKENVDKSKVVTFGGGEVIGKCPRCSGDVAETPKAYSCNSNCGFILWKANKFFESAKKPFTKEIAIALLKDGKVEVNGLYSPKTGKTYNAVVCLDDANPHGGNVSYINFKLEFPKKEVNLCRKKLLKKPTKTCG